MPSEFSELFTRAAREVAPLAGRKGLSLGFDCRVPPTLLPGDTTSLRCTLYCLLCAGIELIDRGLLTLDASVASADERDGGCVIDVRISGAGHLAADTVIDEVLQRLRLSEALGRDNARAMRWRHAVGRGPRGDAPTRFTIDRGRGSPSTRASPSSTPARPAGSGRPARPAPRPGWSTTMLSPAARCNDGWSASAGRRRCSARLPEPSPG